MKVELNEKSIRILEFYKEMFQTKDFDSTLVEMVIAEIDYQQSWDWKVDGYIEKLLDLIGD